MFLLILALFVEFKAKRGQYGSKKRKRFYKCVLESRFTSVSGLGGAILSKKFKLLLPYCAYTVHVQYSVRILT
jgi:hypothetical protein